MRGLQNLLDICTYEHMDISTPRQNQPCGPIRLRVANDSVIVQHTEQTAFHVIIEVKQGLAPQIVGLVTDLELWIPKPF